MTNWAKARNSAAVRAPGDYRTGDPCRHRIRLPPRQSVSHQGTSPARSVWNYLPTRRHASFYKVWAGAGKPDSAKRQAFRARLRTDLTHLFGTVTPIQLATDAPRRSIRVGSWPVAIAVTPDGRTAYVVNSGSGTVTPMRTATG